MEGHSTLQWWPASLWRPPVSNSKHHVTSLIHIYIYTHTHIYIYRLHEGRTQFTSINHQIGAFEFARRSRISDHTTRLSHDPRPGGHLDKQADFLRAQLLTSLVGGRTRWIQIQCTNVLKQPSFLKFYHFTLWSLCPTYKNVVLVLEQYLLLLLLVHLPVGTFSNGFGSNPQKTADTSSHNTCPSCPACHHKRFSPTQYCADRPFPKVLRWTTRWFLLGELGQKVTNQPTKFTMELALQIHYLWMSACPKAPCCNLGNLDGIKGKSMIIASMSQSVLPTSSYVCRSK